MDYIGQRIAAKRKILDEGQLHERTNAGRVMLWYWNQLLGHEFII